MYVISYSTAVLIISKISSVCCVQAGPAHLTYDDARHASAPAFFDATGCQQQQHLCHCAGESDEGACSFMTCRSDCDASLSVEEAGPRYRADMVTPRATSDIKTATNAITRPAIPKPSAAAPLSPAVLPAMRPRSRACSSCAPPVVGADSTERRFRNALLLSLSTAAACSSSIAHRAMCAVRAVLSLRTKWRRQQENAENLSTFYGQGFVRHGFNAALDCNGTQAFLGQAPKVPETCH